MERFIKVKINPNGSAEIEGQNFKGNTCLPIINQLSKLMGIETEDHPKNETFEVEEHISVGESNG